jgi:hypothetical protein
MACLKNYEFCFEELRPLCGGQFELLYFRLRGEAGSRFTPLLTSSLPADERKTAHHRHLYARSDRR